MNDHFQFLLMDDDNPSHLHYQDDSFSENALLHLFQEFNLLSDLSFAYD